MNERVASLQVSQDATAIDTAGYAGFLERAEPSAVAGWIKNRERTPQPVDLLLNDVRVARVVPTIHRPDIEAPGDAAGGFFLNPVEVFRESELAWGRVTAALARAPGPLVSIKVGIPDSGPCLQPDGFTWDRANLIHAVFPWVRRSRIESKSAGSEELYGQVDSISANGVVGWIVQLRAPFEPVLLEVLFCGTHVAYTASHAVLPKISRVFGPGVVAGFQLQWSERLGAGQLLESQQPAEDGWTVRVVNDGTALPMAGRFRTDRAERRSWIRNAHTSDPPAPSEALLGCSNGRLRGALPTSGRTSGAVIIEIDGHVVDVVRATPRRKGGLGFSWRIPPSIADEVHSVRALDAGYGISLTKSPLVIGAGMHHLVLDTLSGGELRGRACERVTTPAPSTVRVVLDGREHGSVTADQLALPPGADDGAKQIPCGFSVNLPADVWDGAPHEIELQAGNLALKQTHQIRLDGYVDHVSRSRIAGWVMDRNGRGPDPAISLELHVNNTLVATKPANLPRPDVNADCGFEFELPAELASTPTFTFELRIPNTSIGVLETPRLWFDPASLTTMLRSMAAHARVLQSGGACVEAEMLAHLAKLARQGSGSPTGKELSRTTTGSAVSIIVPVYAGYGDTMRCLAALQRSLPEQRNAQCHVIVVDDVGPDPHLRTTVRAFCERHGFEHAQNERNLGFVATVNRALRLRPPGDAILLNSDAMVHGDWADRLHRAAYSRQNVASVTPLSNNATIFSYPTIGEHPSPGPEECQRLDGLFRSLNAGHTVEVPTGVGFCMYLRAEALDAVGLLDEETWGKGYGEENDWCMRASDRGFVHLAACDVFVEHTGGASFGAERKEKQVKENVSKLLSLYPDYQVAVDSFVDRDPLRPFRNAATIKLMKAELASARCRMAFVTHGLGGGIQTHLEDMISGLQREGASVVVIRGDARRIFVEHASRTLEFSPLESLGPLIDALRHLEIEHFHYHSDIGLPRGIWDLPAELGAAYDVTVHDYSCLCPRVNLTDPSGNYCGQPADVPQCEGCMERHGPMSCNSPRLRELGSSVAAWRDFHRSKLALARRIFLPHEDVADRLRDLVPLKAARVLPHPAPVLRCRVGPSESGPEKWCIAVIGGIGPHKGYSLLRECLEIVDGDRLPLKFTIVGHSCDDAGLRRYESLEEITGAYARTDLQEVLRAKRYGAALLPSRWPETYSYTLDEAVIAGIPPVVFDIGAPAARLRKLGIGRVLPMEADARTVCLALVQFCNSTSAKEILFRSGDYVSLLREYYDLQPGTG